MYNFLEFFFQRQQSIGELATIQNANNPCLNAPNPCNNGGQCFYSQGSITCMCNEGFDGQRCEIDLCQSMSCPANAECRNGVCQCSEGFTSKYTYLLYLPISYIIYICEKAWTWQSATEKVGEKGRQLEIFLKEVKEEGGGIDIRSVLTFLS